jgi:hypothetical protein
VQNSEPLSARSRSKEKSKYIPSEMQRNLHELRAREKAAKLNIFAMPCERAPMVYMRARGDNGVPAEGINFLLRFTCHANAL